MAYAQRHVVSYAELEARPCSPAIAYWAGFLLADGYVREKCPCLIVELASGDRKHLAALGLFLAPT